MCALHPDFCFIHICFAAKSQKNRRWQTSPWFLKEIKTEGDLGVMNSSVKMLTFWTAAEWRANSMMGIFRKRIENTVANIIMPRHRSIMCTHLEQWAQFWLQSWKNTHIGVEPIWPSNEERPKSPGLFSLEKKKAKGAHARVSQNHAWGGRNGYKELFLHYNTGTWEYPMTLIGRTVTRETNGKSGLCTCIPPLPAAMSLRTGSTLLAVFDPCGFRLGVSLPTMPSGMWVVRWRKLRHRNC